MTKQQVQHRHYIANEVPDKFLGHFGFYSSFHGPIREIPNERTSTIYPFNFPSVSLEQGRISLKRPERKSLDRVLAILKEKRGVESCIEGLHLDIPDLFSFWYDCRFSEHEGEIYLTRFGRFMPYVNYDPKNFTIIEKTERLNDFDLAKDKSLYKYCSRDKDEPTGIPLLILSANSSESLDKIENSLEIPNAREGPSCGKIPLIWGREDDDR